MDSRLLWLALVAFVGATEGGLIAGLLPAISEEMGVSIGQAGQVVLGYSLAYAIGTPVLAVVLGGIGRRRVIAGAEFVLGICALLIAVSPFFLWIVGVRTVLAIGAGTVTGTAMATAAMIAAPGQRGRALQIVTMGQSLAVLLGVPLGAYIAAHFSWRVNYAAIAVMAVAAATVLYFRLPRGLLGDTQTMRDRIRVLGNPGVLPALLTTLLLMAGSNGAVIYIAAIIQEAGVGRDMLPIVLLANGIGAVISSMSAGWLTDRLGNVRAVTVSIVVLIVALVELAVLPHLPQELRLVTLLVANGLIGYVAWAYWIAHCSQMANLAPSSVPVAISLDMAALSFGMALAAGLGGLVVDTWGAGMLSAAGIPIVIAAMAVWIWSQKRGDA